MREEDKLVSQLIELTVNVATAARQSYFSTVTQSDIPEEIIVSSIKQWKKDYIDIMTLSVEHNSRAENGTATVKDLYSDLLKLDEFQQEVLFPVMNVIDQYWESRTS